MQTLKSTAVMQSADAQYEAINGPWPTIVSHKACGKEGAQPPGAIASDTATEGVAGLNSDTPPKEPRPSYLAVANGTAPKTLATNPKTVLGAPNPKGGFAEARSPTAAMTSLGTGNMPPGGNKAAAHDTKPPLPPSVASVLGSIDAVGSPLDDKTDDEQPKGDAKGDKGATAEAAGSSKAGPSKKTAEKAGKKAVGAGKGAKGDKAPAKREGGAKSKSDKKKEAQKPAKKITACAPNGAGSAAERVDAASPVKNTADGAATSTGGLQGEPTAPAFSLKPGSAGACRFAGARRVAAGKPRPDKGGSDRCVHSTGGAKGGVKARKQAASSSKAAKAASPVTNGAPTVEAAAEDEGIAVKGTLDEVETAPAAPDQECDNAGPSDTAGDCAATDAATCCHDEECCECTAAAEGDAACDDERGSVGAAAEEEVAAPCCGAAAFHGPTRADTAATASCGPGSTCPGVVKDLACARAPSCGGGDGPGTPDSTTDARRPGPFRWGSGASRLSSASSSLGRCSSTGSGASAAACEDEGASGPLGAGGRLSSCAGQLLSAQAAAALPADDAAAAQPTEANFGSRLTSAALQSAAVAVAEDEEQGEEQEEEQQEEQQPAVTAAPAAEPLAAAVARRRRGSRLRSLVCWSGVALAAVCCGAAFGLVRARRR